MTQASVLVAEDFSAVGRMSTTAAISIFSGFGIQTAAVPTEVLSTQTEGFGKPAVLKTDDWIKRALKHWRTVSDLDLSGAVVGYVGSAKTCELLADFLTQSAINRVIVNPVLGDRGALYDGFDAAYVDAVKKLIATATVITPNITELALLTHTHLVPESSDADILAAIDKLTRAFDNHPRVVVTSVHRDAGMGSCFERDGQLSWNGAPLVTGHFYGTGDLFTALLCGYLDFGITFESAVQRAVMGTYEAVTRTAKQAPEQRKYGMDLTKTLSDVTKFTLGQRRGEF